MKRTGLTFFLVLIGLAAIAAYLTLFTVHQTQQALVLEFGKPKRLVTDPGLNWKIPFIQNVEFFDKRLLALDSSPLPAGASPTRCCSIRRWETSASPARGSALSWKHRSGACSAHRASRRWCATSATR